MENLMDDSVDVDTIELSISEAWLLTGWINQAARAVGAEFPVEGGEWIGVICERIMLAGYPIVPPESDAQDHSGPEPKS